MIDYCFTPASPGYDHWKILSFAVTLLHVIRREFPSLPPKVKVVNYPSGSVRIINLHLLDDETQTRLTNRANDVFGYVMRR
jgi:hypothetical protein